MDNWAAAVFSDGPSSLQQFNGRTGFKVDCYCTVSLGVTRKHGKDILGGKASTFMLNHNNNMRI